MAAASLPYNAGIFTQILTTIDKQLQDALTSGIIGEALQIMQYLAAMEVVIACLWYAYSHQDQFVSDLFCLGIKIGVHAQLVAEMNYLAGLFTDGCIYFGLLFGNVPSGVMGWTPFTVEQFHDPGAIMLAGWQLFTPLIVYVQKLGLLDTVFHTATIGLYAAVALMGWACIGVIGICTLVAWVELWVCVAWGGLLFLWTIFRYTAFIGEGVLETVVGCGVRLGLLATLLALSYPLLTSMQVTEPTDPDIGTALALFGIGLVFAVLVLKIPALQAKLSKTAPIYYFGGMQSMARVTVALATSQVAGAVASVPQRLGRGA
jgi:type IV secretory pathway TrbL component